MTTVILVVVFCACVYLVALTGGALALTAFWIGVAIASYLADKRS